MVFLFLSISLNKSFTQNDEQALGFAFKLFIIILYEPTVETTKTYNSNRSRPPGIVRMTMKFVYEFKEANGGHDIPIPMIKRDRWVPRQKGLLKINVDGAIFV